MKLVKANATQGQMMQEIERFVHSSQGLRWLGCKQSLASILQVIDSKVLRFRQSDIEEVLHRSDNEGRGFLQVNFIEGKKILITDTMVGFKPIVMEDFDPQKLPKVVTTPDLMSVLEAMEDLDVSPQSSREELEVLKKIFLAIVAGGEEVGFDLAAERNWLHQFSHFPRRAVA